MDLPENQLLAPNERKAYKKTVYEKLDAAPLLETPEEVIYRLRVDFANLKPRKGDIINDGNDHYYTRIFCLPLADP